VETVRIANLKSNYLKKFPDTVLADIILQEKDELTPMEFLIKAEIWIEISDLQERMAREELKF